MTSAAIMLYASPGTCDPALGPAAFARGMAASLDAHLSVFLPCHNVLSLSWEGRSAQEVELEEERLLQVSTTLAEEIAAKARDESVSVSTQVEWSHAFGLMSYIAERAKLHDFIVTGTEHDSNLSERHVAEYILFETGRPVLIVPNRRPPNFSCDRVTIAWDYSRGAARVLHDALPLLRLASEVVLVAVGGEKDFQTNLEKQVVVKAMARKGLGVRFEQIELDGNSIGNALQGFANEADSDLLIMGAYGHSRFREFILGGATRDILNNPKLPVLLSH